VKGEIEVQVLSGLLISRLTIRSDLERSLFKASCPEVAEMLCNLR
jgi:hypothetical protein